MRIVFMGTPEFAVPTLEGLINAGYRVVGVVTQPDRPKGRGQRIHFSPVKDCALKHGLATFQPDRLSDPDFFSVLKNLGPDMIVVAAFGQLLPPAVLRLPRYGCLNVHASLLPKYRGAAPVQRAIVNGEKETGITTIFMDEGLDTGDILLQKALSITDEDTAGTLQDRLAQLGAQALLESLRLVVLGRARRHPQDPAKATYASALSREDEIINWNTSARRIFNQVRGLNPAPGAVTAWEGQLLKIWRVEIFEGESLLMATLPGQVRTVNAEEGLLVQANPGLVLVKELQIQGKKRMEAAQFLRGRAIPVGAVLG